MSHAGAKQGWPFRPALFGLFLDGLHRKVQIVQVQCPMGRCIFEDSRCLRVVAYADGVLPLAPSPEVCGIHIVDTFDGGLKILALIALGV